MLNFYTLEIKKEIKYFINYINSKNSNYKLKYSLSPKEIKIIKEEVRELLEFFRLLTFIKGNYCINFY